jgi:poly [ADP-ribose] polymerase
LTRQGRVGLPLQVRQRTEASDLKTLTAKFRRVFRQKTGLAWKERHERCPPQRSGFNFVELDYRWSSARQPGNLPNYETVDASIHSELRELMETILYGSPTRRDTEKEPHDNAGKPEAGLRFSAPFVHLSAWAIFLAFKTLQRIAKCLDSCRPISWKAILRASSLYRSQIPFCAGHNRAPVISCYHSIFLELKFLHSLWPRPEIAGMLSDIYLRGSLQLRAHKMLAQPLYRAYSSLRHGFRRLTDPWTLEFQELKKYLEKSCHTLHRLKIELQDIYSVFIKAGLPNPYRDGIERNQGYDVSGQERLLLWHGTALESLLGILELGLQIRRPGFSWTGTMFGNGIYLADASSKSATFCKYQQSGGDAVLLLCEANVGRQRRRCVNSMETAHDIIRAPGSQYRCVEGLGKIGPGAWRDVGWDMRGAPSSATVRMVCRCGCLPLFCSSSFPASAHRDGLF